MQKMSGGVVTANILAQNGVTEAEAARRVRVSKGPDSPLGLDNLHHHNNVTVSAAVSECPCALGTGGAAW